MAENVEMIRPINLPEAQQLSENDVFILDSETGGVRKIPKNKVYTPVDDTLSESGEAADAKVTGEKIDELKGETALIQNPVGNKSGELVSFSDGAEMPAKSVVVNIEPKQSGTGTPSPDNVRPISGWSSVNVTVSPTQDAQDGTTTPVPLGRTVYGGTLDVVSGVLTVDRAMVDLGSLTWGTLSDSPYGNFSTTALAQLAKQDQTKPTFICNTYDGAAFNTASSTADNYIWLNNNKTLIVKDTSKASMTASDFKTAMSGVQFCYELANPQTYTLTGQEISTLLGDNNVWADSGDVEITYRKDINIVIDELTNAIVSLGSNV